MGHHREDFVEMKGRGVGHRATAGGFCIGAKMAIARDWQCSNGERPVNGRRYSAHRRHSIFSALRASVLWWCHTVGLRLVLLELRSLRIRILLQRQNGIGVLDFEAVRRSVPPICACDSPTENNTYIAGIRTLKADRPWMTLGDCELFLQGWFQAEYCRVRNEDTELNTSCRTLAPHFGVGVPGVQAALADP